MPDPAQPRELRTHLVNLGCPGNYAARVVRELSEHRVDLEAEALAGGLSVAEAARYAAERMNQQVFEGTALGLTALAAVKLLVF